ncbi:hypothetical protein BT67DRAFT_443190 [Trichocladium antarcticum]|uniref:Uncharacterized protein n=1 Tax=Trichocladium antarcticum TaxID=1450529 RepID=A0AAN6UKB9_9PEZI|nr:hypothetical protein BT67DRAFT_443190 [Trichocladium antarcticum]
MAYYISCVRDLLLSRIDIKCSCSSSPRAVTLSGLQFALLAAEKSLPISKINGIFIRILPLQSGSHRAAIKRSRGLS